MSLSPPRIVCAAVRYMIDGSPFVIAGPRHYDRTMHSIRKQIGTLNDQRPEQGFIDQHGTFYTRKEAWTVAVRNDQIVKRVGGDGDLGFGLFSENLY